MVKQIIRQTWRYPLCKYYQRKLKRKNFTIISSDCTGGCLYHDLGLRFTSPTINLIIPKSLDFFERLEHYLRIEPVPDGYSTNGAPVILLENVQVIGVHYHDHDQLIQKWNERRTRIVWQNIIILSNIRFVSTKEDRERFSKLPYPKILFIGEKPSYDFERYSPALLKKKDLTAYCDLLGRRYFEKYLNCVQFLNESVE